MRAVQTPQCFDLALLKSAFNTPYQDQFTDDASVVEAAGHVVTLCEGDPWNVKVTTPEDLVIKNLDVWNMLIDFQIQNGTADD